MKSSSCSACFFFFFFDPVIVINVINSSAAYLASGTSHVSRSFSHPNLVKLYASFSRPISYVMELFPLGSLDRLYARMPPLPVHVAVTILWCLHHTPNCITINLTFAPAGWSQKQLPQQWAAVLHIALDIARGLEFLHHRALPYPILHRDLKVRSIASNPIRLSVDRSFDCSRLPPLICSAVCKHSG
jgi:serine/threonine protein kinase